MAETRTVRLLTIQQVAELLGVHTDTVKNLAIPFTKVGRQRRYHPKIVDKYLADHSSRPDAWARGTAA